MLIVGRDLIEPFLRDNAGARSPMSRWMTIASEASWRNILDARMTFRHADVIRGTSFTCFNIAGNRYRLLTIVSYEQQMISIVKLLTHADYSKKFA